MSAQQAEAEDALATLALRTATTDVLSALPTAETPNAAHPALPIQHARLKC